MTSEISKKRRVSSRRVVVPRPGPLLSSESKSEVPFHPIFWVECFGCSGKARQLRGSDGRAYLPEGWATLYLTNRESREESPDVYASEDCIHRAALRLSRYDSNAVTVLKAPRVDFIDFRVTLAAAESGEGVKKDP